MLTSILLTLASLTAFCGNSAAQNAPTPSSVPQQELLLTRANDGQTHTAKVGQPIVVTLQTIGGGHYDLPKISSHSVRFDSAVFPPKQNPGGPTQVYRFTAIAEGEAQIRIPHTGSNPTVTFIIRVKKP